MLEKSDATSLTLDSQEIVDVSAGSWAYVVYLATGELSEASQLRQIPLDLTNDLEFKLEKQEGGETIIYMKIQKDTNLYLPNINNYDVQKNLTNSTGEFITTATTLELKETAGYVIIGIVELIGCCK